MTVHSLINPSATLDLGKADFLAADLTERAARRSSAAAERIQAQRDLQQAEQAFVANFRERFSDDLGETTLALDAARELADLAVAFRAQADSILGAIRNVEPLLVARTGYPLNELATDLLTDELSRDPLARDLAGVVSAALKAGVQ